MHYAFLKVHYFWEVIFFPTGIFEYLATEYQQNIWVSNNLCRK